MNLQDKQNLSQGILSIACAIFLILVYFNTDRTKWGNVKDADLLRVKTKMAETPKISQSSRGTYNLSLKVVEFLEYRFVNSGIFYTATDAEAFSENVRPGDSIAILLLENEYELKISKKRRENWFNRAIDNQTNLSLYGLESGGRKYIDLDKINRLSSFNKSKWASIFEICFSLALFAFGVSISYSLEVRTTDNSFGDRSSILFRQKKIQFRARSSEYGKIPLSIISPSAANNTPTVPKSSATTTAMTSALLTVRCLPKARSERIPDFRSSANI